MSTRIQRIIRLITLLQMGQHNLDSLNTLCKVSKRTLFRDMATIRQSGLPVTFHDNRKGYSALSDIQLPGSSGQITSEEAIALMTLCFGGGQESIIPFLDEARNAVLKMHDLFPDDVKRTLRRLGDAVQIHPEPALSDRKDLYLAILEALEHRRVLRIWVHEEGRELSTFLHPYHLVFRQPAWHVFGWSTLHKDHRIYALDRIVRHVITDMEYDLPEYISLKRFLKNAWRILPEEGPDEEVVIRFSEAVAHRVGRVRWHGTQNIRRHANGTLDFRVTVSGLNEIVPWILAFGKEAEVIRPQRLRELIREHVAGLWAKYECSTKKKDAKS